MFCKKCGNKLNKDDAFCSNCGSSVKSETTVSDNVGSTNETNGILETIEAGNQAKASSGTIDPSNETDAVLETVVSTNEANAKEDSKTFFKEWLTPNGRFGRWRYVKNIIALSVIYLLISICLGLFSETLSKIVLVPYLYFMANIEAKRFHDFGYGSIYAYLFAILSLSLDIFYKVGNILLLFILIIIELCLVFIKGNKGANKYGQDPLEK